MATVENKKWRHYWSDKSKPLHRRDGEQFYRQFANELNVILSEIEYQSVLDLGCGNGALYAPLSFDKCEYTGVDFSGSMLADFANRHPEANLIEADASSYLDNRHYDLITSSGVLQYFDRAACDLHFDNCRRMMHTDSAILHAGIPWSKQKWFYRSGWGPGKQPYHDQPLRQIVRPIYSAIHEQIGYWFSPAQLSKIAGRHGMECQFYGSIHYMYRFHVLLKLR